MNSKTVFPIILTLTVVLGLFVWGFTSRQNNADSLQNTVAVKNALTDLTTPEKFHDFGVISMKNGNVSKEFTVTNSTGGDITISRITTSCMCTTAFIAKSNGSLKGPFGMPGHGTVPPANETIGAGESRIVKVVFDPNAHGPAGIGRIDRFVTLSDSSGGAIELEIKATVTP